MKHIRINPSKLKGSIAVPSSKSLCHRAVICASLSEGVSNIENLFFSQDVKATCQAMSNLGVEVVYKGESKIKIRGTSKLEAKGNSIDCFESGSTLRFLIPIAATLGEEVTFNGKGKLVARPLGDYYRIFEEQQIQYENINGKLPLTINGRLKSGEYRIKGDVSSQFISGLLFALPLLEGDSRITVTTELQSKAYVDLTIDVLKAFSIEVKNVDYREFTIKGNQKYIASDYKVEGDFSQAAFWLVANVLGSEVVCNGMSMNSLQGDKVIIETIKSMGGEIVVEGEKVKALPSQTKGTVIDASECPDLVPVLTVLGALSEGTTEIVNAERLRFKESDRLAAITSELNKIGADIEEKEDRLIIRGKETLIGGKVNSWNDHRIAMALAVASTRCKEPLIIEDADSVKKSYPNFWEHFKELGGSVDEWNLG
ncbi:3-phosphoshikimate 1-carboxyvinyltransferase [Clostridium sp. A1-XYC3]|uniref:3-phosphoshikimate 1-carboxyvinyltransferase n=1 Tax=Clostridium tanneri TaxID=3037988 RepID=A0ABU4JQK8_9CLOT|nr:3-phosphoshikimate 1-carboxyvinyltransferase [Clostridium sp. A1-XYC3]MDW8800435.1 3-phosphoshikimate 1-carboxyvinyltransferase [Clostridium sp. A1-XYC3]